jgi:predicted amidophosphoribosyltransferase
MAKQQKKKGHLFCPYCEEEMRQADLPYCRACQLTIFYCPKCRKPLPREKRVCPHCGTEIKG